MGKATNLKVLDERAAFIDVGSEKMHVSIAGGPPEVFGTMIWSQPWPVSLSRFGLVTDRFYRCATDGF